MSLVSLAASFLRQLNKRKGIGWTRRVCKKKSPNCKINGGLSKKTLQSSTIATINS